MRLTVGNLQDVHYIIFKKVDICHPECYDTNV